MSFMFCLKCGKEIPNDSKTCPICGEEVISHKIEDPVNNVSSNSKSEETKKKTSRLLIVLIIFLVILITVLGIIFFTRSNSSSRKIFNKAINYAFNKIETNLPEPVNTIANNYSFKVNLDLSKEVISPEYYSFLNNLNFKGTMAVDYKNKSFLTSLSPEYNNAKVADLTIYASNGSAYANLGDLFDKYIKFDVSEEDYNLVFDTLNSTNNKGSVKNVLNEIKSSLTDALKDEYFKVEDETLTIDNKEVTTKRHRLVLDEKTYTTIGRDILSYLNNDKFLDDVSEIYISNQTTGNKEDVRSNLKESIEEQIETFNKLLEEDNFDLDTKEYVSLYVNKADNSFVSLTISTGTSNSENELTMFEVTKTAKEKYIFDITNENNVKVCNGEISLTDTEDNYKIIINGINNTNRLSTESIEFNLNIVKNTTNIYTLSVKQEKIGTAKVTFTNTSKINDVVTIPSFSNYTNYEELTEKDFNNILQKLMAKESVNNLTKDIEVLIPIINNIKF